MSKYTRMFLALPAAVAGAGTCAMPGELRALEHYPVLRQGPFSKSPVNLKAAYRVTVTDNDGETYVDLFDDTSPVAFFATRGGRLFQLGGHHSPVKELFRHFAYAVAQAAQHHGMADADFCYDATDNDAFILDKLQKTQLYCASQITWLPARYPIIAVPNEYYEKSLLEDHMGTVPWDEKVNKIYWRGGLTGTPNMYEGKSDDPFFNIPRVLAYQVAQRSPHMWNFGFVHIDDQLTGRYMKGVANQEQANFLKLVENSLVPNEDFDKQLPRHRYLLNVDGIVAAWRLRDLLRSGSVVLHFVGKSAEFFFRDLEPWRHYVPVTDLDELPQLYEKLEADQALAKSIAQQGRAYADAHLTLEGQNCYLASFLEFIKNRTAYDLPGPEVLQSLGFAEVNMPFANKGFLRRQRSEV